MPFTPKDLLDRVGQEKILNRFYSLDTIYTAKIQPNCPNTFLQKFILRNAVESYFCDLQHSKDFHDIELADRHKVAAFTIKWIVKSRPIQLNEAASPGGPYILLVNEIFALMAGLIHLSANIEQLSSPIFRSLLYTLHNRTVDAETLSAMMYTIECALNSKKP
jgi:hypothetical protein